MGSHKFTLYDFELSPIATVEATKSIRSAKGESAVDYNTITRWFKKFRLDCKNYDDQVSLRSRVPKI